MVKGIEVFRKYFGIYAGQYVFIGGTACDLILGKKNAEFRATRDFDVVLIIEALSAEFMNCFSKFVLDGGYQHVCTGTGRNQFYRFSKPEDRTFPSMIELFSRKPDYLSAFQGRLGPIHVSDETISLSAILLDDDYYSLIRKGMIIIDEIAVLDIPYLILFKMKAFLDLADRYENGDKIDRKNIRKHRNDVVRLAVNLEPGTKIRIDGQVKKDAAEFLRRISTENIEIWKFGITGVSFQEILCRLKECYNID